MSLSKLAQAAASAVKEITSKKAINTSTKVAQQAKTVSKNAKGALDALAVQGKAMVKKFDVATDKMADKINKAVEDQKQFDKSVNEIKTFAAKITDGKINLKKTLPDDQVLVINGDQTRWVKSAKDSAMIIDSTLSLTEGLANKSAKESAEVIMKGGDTPAVAAMRERVAKYNTPEMKAKKAQMDLKRELKAKHADKLQ